MFFPGARVSWSQIYRAGQPSPGTGAAYDTTYEQMGDWLEEIAGEFPDAFFEELDGGIQLEEAALPDPDFPPR